MFIEKGNSFPSSPKDRERFGIFDPTIVTPEYIEPEAKTPPEGFDQFGRLLPGYKIEIVDGKISAKRLTEQDDGQETSSEAQQQQQQTEQTRGASGRMTDDELYYYTIEGKLSGDSDFGEEGSTAPRQPEKDQRAPQNPDTQPQVAASETQATQAGNNLEQQEPTEPTEAELQARLAALEKRLKTEQRNMQNGLGGDPVGVQAQIEQIRKQIEQQSGKAQKASQTPETPQSSLLVDIQTALDREIAEIQKDYQSGLFESQTDYEEAIRIAKQKAEILKELQGKIDDYRAALDRGEYASLEDYRNSAKVAIDAAEQELQKLGLPSEQIQKLLDKFRQASDLQSGLQVKENKGGRLSTADEFAMQRGGVIEEKLGITGSAEANALGTESTEPTNNPETERESEGINRFKGYIKAALDALDDENMRKNNIFAEAVNQAKGDIETFAKNAWKNQLNDEQREAILKLSDDQQKEAAKAVAMLQLLENIENDLSAKSLTDEQKNAIRIAIEAKRLKAKTTLETILNANNSREEATNNAVIGQERVIKATQNIQKSWWQKIKDGVTYKLIQGQQWWLGLPKEKKMLVKLAVPLVTFIIGVILGAASDYFSDRNDNSNAFNGQYGDVPGEGTPDIPSTPTATATAESPGDVPGEGTPDIPSTPTATATAESPGDVPGEGNFGIETQVYQIRPGDSLRGIVENDIYNGDVAIKLVNDGDFARQFYARVIAMNPDAVQILKPDGTYENISDLVRAAGLEFTPENVYKKIQEIFTGSQANQYDLHIMNPGGTLKIPSQEYMEQVLATFRGQ